MYRRICLAVIGLLWMAPSLATAQGDIVASASTSVMFAQRQLMFSASATADAVRRASEPLEQAYNEIDHQLALRREERRELLAERERRRTSEIASAAQIRELEDQIAELEVEVGGLLVRGEALLAEIARQDAEYAAAIQYYREGIEGLFSSSDPRIVEALERYAGGDASALDDVQSIARLNADARQAGVAARNAIEQRYIAILWSDARDRGQRTTQQVIAAWELATEYEPAQFWQWSNLVGLYLDVADETNAQLAAEKMLSYAANDHHRAIALRQIGRVSSLRAAIHIENPLQEALSLFRSLALIQPANESYWNSEIADTLLAIASTATVGGDVDSANEAIEEALGLANEMGNPNDPSSVASSVRWLAMVRISELELQRGDGSEALRAAEIAVELARQRLQMRPESLALVDDLARSFQKRAQAYRQLGDGFRSLADLEVETELRERVFAARPDDPFKVWSAQTSLAMIARYLGEYEKAYRAFTRALEVGEPYAEDQSLSFLAELTFSRLSNVAAVMGNFDQAQMLLRRDLAVTRRAPERRRSISEANALIGIAQLHVLANEPVEALAILDQAQQELSNHPDIEPNSRMIGWLLAMTWRGQAYLAMGDLALAQTSFTQILGFSDTLLRDSLNRHVMRLLSQFYLVHFPGSGITWESLREGMREAAPFAGDTINDNGTYILSEGISVISDFADRMVAQPPAETFAESVESTLAIARQLETEGASSRTLKGLVAHQLRMLALLPGHVVQWSDLANELLSMRDEGYFRTEQDWKELDDALAAAASEAARRNAQ